jgi:hypothetical protein
MQESLSSEHSTELITNTLEEFLDRGGVTDEGRRHSETTWWDGAESGLDIVGNPLNEVAGVLVLHVTHLIFNLLHTDVSTEDGRASKVSTVSEIGSSHHVLGIVHLLSEFWDRDCSERVGASAGKRSETDHEEMKTWEGNHVDSQLSKIGVELTRESQASSDTWHDGWHEVVQVTIWGSGQLEGSHADVIESLWSLVELEYTGYSSYLVVNAEGLIGVLNELMNRECGVVWFDNGIGDLWRRYDRESGHHSIWEFFSDLGDQ